MCECLIVSTDIVHVTCGGVIQILYGGKWKVANVIADESAIPCAIISVPVGRV